ncbi:MAG: DUF1704 domain-containing protein [Candidatus Nanoarchaeia archaeon]|nr:DUF1704 domain-containing protein [Candidatus Nanoarchaeia archaeon]
MINLEDLESLDKKLIELGKNIRPLYYIEPQNREDQKMRFLAGNIKNPEFSYRSLEYDPEKVERELKSIEVSYEGLGNIFMIKKINMVLMNNIIANRGNGEIVRSATILIHNTPDEKLVSYADGLLKKIPAQGAEKIISSDLIGMNLKEALEKYGILDWKIIFSDKELTAVNAARKEISICKTRLFSKIDPERLKVHEIGVHVLRAANGYEQPLGIFATGLPRYDSTEEGLTLYFENKTGSTNDELMRDYAARVIAVDSVCKGLDFRNTFDRLKSYDLTDDQAWNLAVRGHRGGGYIKDHIYLQGLLKIMDFERTDGDFKTLYIGKIGIEDLPLVRELIKEGTLKKAKYLPDFLN